MKPVDLALFAGAALLVAVLIITRRGASAGESPGAAGKTGLTDWKDVF